MFQNSAEDGWEVGHADELEVLGFMWAMKTWAVIWGKGEKKNRFERSLEAELTL